MSLPKEWNLQVSTNCFLYSSMKLTQKHMNSEQSHQPSGDYEIGRENFVFPFFLFTGCVAVVRDFPTTATTQGSMRVGLVCVRLSQLVDFGTHSQTPVWL